MDDKLSFNLVTDPWIKVISKEDYDEKEVSLTELFKNTKAYCQLAGDSKSQDLAILRLLLAILVTVYTRFDSNDEQYGWIKLEDNWQVIKIDEDIDNLDKTLLKTWKKLYKQRSFSNKVVEYLDKYKSKFDLFGQTPFYQVSREVYDQNVDAKKQVAKGKGTVSVKQINRRVSESNNTPSIFSPKSEGEKNKVNLAELTRWLITYQNFSGVTDKTKVVSKEKFSSSKGWLFSISPVYIKGNDLFETLMLNLTLTDDGAGQEFLNQKPVWEYDGINEYIKRRLVVKFPDNLAELYTLWSRMLHIEWNNGEPTIFTAGLPKVDSENVFLEPMTTWRTVKDGGERPATKSKNNLNVAMWRNFGQYVPVYTGDDKESSRIPGVVLWVQDLRNKKGISKEKFVNLVSVAMISDGNATSQSPYSEVVDNMEAEAGVLFDENPELSKYWPKRIEGAVLDTQKIASYFYWFTKEFSELRGVKDSSWANKAAERFYDRLNSPFYSWLSSITEDSNREEKVREWRKTLNRIVAQQAKEVFALSASAEIIGKGKDNAFTIYNKLKRNVYVYLKSK